MSLAYLMNANNAIGSTYMAQAEAMGHRMGIFGAPSLTFVEPRDQIAAAVTAWGLYGFETILAFHLRRSPSLITPPSWPQPEYDRAAMTFGEIYIAYPGYKDTVPMNIGSTVVALMELFMLMNRITYDSFHKSANENEFTSEQALAYRAKLITWFNRLPKSLSPVNIVLPCALKLQ